MEQSLSLRVDSVSRYEKKKVVLVKPVLPLPQRNNSYIYPESKEISKGRGTFSDSDLFRASPGVAEEATASPCPAGTSFRMKWGDCLLSADLMLMLMTSLLVPSKGADFEESLRKKVVKPAETFPCTSLLLIRV